MIDTPIPLPTRFDGTQHPAGSSLAQATATHRSMVGVGTDLERYLQHVRTHELRLLADFHERRSNGDSPVRFTRSRDGEWVLHDERCHCTTLSVASPTDPAPVIDCPRASTPTPWAPSRNDSGPARSIERALLGLRYLAEDATHGLTGRLNMLLHTSSLGSPSAGLDGEPSYSSIQRAGLAWLAGLDHLLPGWLDLTLVTYLAEQGTAGLLPPHLLAAADHPGAWAELVETARLELDTCPRVLVVETHPRPTGRLAAPALFDLVGRSAYAGPSVAVWLLPAGLEASIRRDRIPFHSQATLSAPRWVEEDPDGALKLIASLLGVDSPVSRTRSADRNAQALAETLAVAQTLHTR